MKTWSPTDITQARPIPGAPMSVLEFKDSKGEWHNFEILYTPDRVVFGGACNTGFLESGYIEREDGELLTETLAALSSDLDTYYDDGPQYVARIVCNERM